MIRSQQASSTTLRNPALGPWSALELRAVVADFISLTKPGIIVLLLISTCCPMVIASRGAVPMDRVFWALVGGALMSGSASALNCIWDRDIDAIMLRTRNRPMAAGRLPLFAALLFSAALGAIGLVVLSHFLNPLSAAISLAGHLFYVFVYTIWLKRRTPQNIVIGGAAGAVPPLVGWAAITGSVNIDAVLMFLVVFLWTPPHFWALALNKNEDYRRANVPMLPVVAGERATYVQMAIYAVLLIPTSLLLVWTNEDLGVFSFVTLLLLGLVFLAKIVKLMRLKQPTLEVKTKAAWDVFSFSLLYLALFFVCLVVDSLLI